MKKTFETPELKAVEINDVDIICTSGCSTFCPGYGTGSVTESISGGN